MEKNGEDKNKLADLFGAWNAILSKSLHFKIENHGDHETKHEENSWIFARGIISWNRNLLEEQGTVTVIQISSKEPWKL